MKWRIYYGDGTTYSDTDAPQDAPAWGVIVIATEDDQIGRLLWNGLDYGWYEFGTWFMGDRVGLLDYLSRPGWKKVIYGRILPNPEFQAILQKAIDDPYLPLKTAGHKLEERRAGV